MVGWHFWYKLVLFNNFLYDIWMNEHLKERELYWPVSYELMAIYRDGSHTDYWEDGTQQWFKNGKLHRDGDLPARIHANGTLVWLKNGKEHRDGDKPVEIHADGTLGWWKNGKIHRDGDKPAWISADGTLWWLKNGLRHRITGPAVIHANKKEEFWINGNDITTEVNAWLKTRRYKVPFTPEQQVEFTLTFS